MWSRCEGTPGTRFRVTIARTSRQFGTLRTFSLGEEAQLRVLEQVNVAFESTAFYISA
jgi:hypothetical protein